LKKRKNGDDVPLELESKRS